MLEIFPIWQRIHCALGIHRGRNFCATCGVQLLADPFFPFRVRNRDGRFSIVLRALNEHHAKALLRGKFLPGELIVERIGED
ncbi:MAG TPA: hypothetical protein VJ654_14575 [Noviherbaspirillum sp.]|nr:hypothetical protein [Noviherbaspirillum sp.]